MEFGIVPDSDALTRCAWCRAYIDENSEVFGLGVTLRPDTDLSQYESHCIELELLSEAKSVVMLVTQKASQARKEGKDGMFMVCSQKCADRLKETLAEDLSLGKLIAGVKDS